MRARAEFGLALLLNLAGAGGVLLVSTRTWQDITVARPGLLPLHLAVGGRAVDGAPTALAVAALAAVVALLATRATLRRIVGGLVLLVGAAAAWRSVGAGAALTAERARALVADRQRGAVLDNAAPVVHVRAVWPVLCVAAAVLIALAGLLVLARGHRWEAMSRRYEASPDGGADAARAGDLAMWKALDRGDDPTA